MPDRNVLAGGESAACNDCIGATPKRDAVLAQSLGNFAPHKPSKRSRANGHDK
jgi:hypothetical protein